MKSRVILVSLILGTSGLNWAEQPSAMKSKKERISYAIGAYIGDYWKRQGLQPDDIDWNLMISAFHAQLYRTPLLMSDKEIGSAIWEFSGDLMARHYQRQRELAQKNRKFSDEFLAKNKAQPGVVTLPGGLQYKVIREGSGASPTSNDLVVVNYRASLADGTELDDSAKHKKPDPPLPISGVKGWAEALQLMKPGARWHVVIPPELAHGELGSYPRIPPNATLVYDIDLISVVRGGNKKTVAAPAPARVSDIIKIPSAEELSKGARIEIIKSDPPPLPPAAKNASPKK